MRTFARIFAGVLLARLALPAFALDSPAEGHAPRLVRIDAKLGGGPVRQTPGPPVFKGIPPLPPRPAGLGEARPQLEASAPSHPAGEPAGQPSPAARKSEFVVGQAEQRFALEAPGDSLARRDELNAEFEKAASQKPGAGVVPLAADHDGVPHFESPQPVAVSAAVPSGRAPNPLIDPANLKPRLPSSYQSGSPQWTGKIVLHMHSTFSDGTMTPEEVVRYAKSQGAEIVVLTDHDTTAGVARAVAEGKRLGITVIPGEEISAAGGTHIVSLGIDIYNPDLMALNAKARAVRYQRARYFLSYLNGLDDIKKSGKVLTMDDLLDLTMYNEGGTIEISHVARLLVKEGIVAKEQDAYDQYFKGDMFGHSDQFPDPVVEDVVKVGHAAGGFLSYAHPFTTRGATPAEQEANRLRVINAGVDAIEAYRAFNPSSDAAKQQADQRATQFLTYGHQYGLMVTAGADFHGLDTLLRTIIVPMPADLADQTMKPVMDRLPAALAALERGPGGGQAPSTPGTSLYSFAPVAAWMSLTGAGSEAVRWAALLGITAAWLWTIKVRYASAFGKKQPPA